MYLGIDLSTQQLKAVVLSPRLTLIQETSVHFDRDLPEYGTVNGSIAGPNGQVNVPVLMWVKGLDLLFERMKQQGIDFGKIGGVSGAGQQHGSVYWSNFPPFDPSKPLVEVLQDSFSVQRAPIWQDSSTMKQCRELEEAVGGPQALTDISGSRAYPRFTASQIAKIYQQNPDAYRHTAHISLVSSFLTSIFAASISPIEIADASGMNLMDIQTHDWSQQLLDATAPDLKEKLAGKPASGGSAIPIGEYWLERWGFNESCIVTPFTGDNPATVLAYPGDALLSLGTSTTFLLTIPPSSTAPPRFTTSHLLAHPTHRGYIAMLCYKNGALAREGIRDLYAEKSWDKFNERVEGSPPGCDGYVGMYFPMTEIIPDGVEGNFFWKDGKYAPTSPKRVVVTGGSSLNPVIRQLAADILDMDVFVSGDSGTKEAAAVGGALLAAWAAAKGDGEEFDQMLASVAPLGHAKPVTAVAQVATPNPERVAFYNRNTALWAEKENSLTTL
ncbi:putative D-xylulose kinase [Mycena floridula]|nr:putative D-xylulose kinase [Mycena floridula]